MLLSNMSFGDIYKKRPPEVFLMVLNLHIQIGWSLVNLHIGLQNYSGFLSSVIDFRVDMKKGRKQQLCFRPFQYTYFRLCGIVMRFSCP